MSRESTSVKIKIILSGILFDLVTDIPEPLSKPSPEPEKAARRLIRSACLKASAVSATLSIPAGIAGIAAALPDMVAVWKIQAQLVSDIALTYGKVAILNRESMMLCLFRHSAAHLLKDLMIHTGSKVIVHKLSTTAFKKTVEKISLKISSRFIRRITLKALPALGALGNGALSCWDTAQVGKTALAYFTNFRTNAEK